MKHQISLVPELSFRRLKCYYLLLTMVITGSATAYCQSLYDATGKASYYAKKFDGRTTANGEKFSSRNFTAAHLTLPFGTLVRVTNLQNNKSIVVRI
ncbi:MAG: septal ring lytic transglycosylase RlpA family protein, partial [Chitinophagales bacterium]